MKKRFIALIMCICMFLGTYSQVFAAEIEDDATIQEEACQDNTNDEDLCTCKEVTYEQLLANVMDDQVTEFKWIDGFDTFKYLTSGDFIEHTQGKRNMNCVPTAVANAFSYFNANGVKMYDGEFTQAMYTTLCGLLSFDPNNGVTWINIEGAIKEFTKLYNRSATFDKYWLNLWSDITRDIGRNRPILISTPEEDNKRHVSLVLGYYIKNGTKILVCLSGYPVPVYLEYVYDSSYLMGAVNIY